MKPKMQFSKKITFFCLINLLVIELYSMIFAWIEKDTNIASLLITSIAAQSLGCVIWYMKNSSVEKKALIESEMYKIDVEDENEGEVLDEEE